MVNPGPLRSASTICCWAPPHLVGGAGAARWRASAPSGLS